MKLTRLKLLISLCCLLSSSACLALAKDEAVLLFPTQASLVADETCWDAPIHGWVFEPEESSVKRSMLLGLFNLLFGREWTAEEESIFRSRAIRFLADSENGKNFSISLGSNQIKLGPTQDHGRVSHTPCLSPKSLPSEKSGWISFNTVPSNPAGKSFNGSIQLVARRGVSVVSDVDDTIKKSNVRDKNELMANTFLRPFAAVEGMAGLYGKWASKGAVFHYVSGTPWQLYEPLSAFMDAEGFPRGGFYLRNFRLTPKGLSEISDPPLKLKRTYIEELMSRFPDRRFVLVGDSGESDPEIYAEMARLHPAQVKRVFIRDVTGEPADCERYQKAFAGVANKTFRIFTNASELSDEEIEGL